MIRLYIIIGTAMLCLVTSCHQRTCHEQMLALLESSRKMSFNPRNPFSPEARLGQSDSLLSLKGLPEDEAARCSFMKASALIQLGEEQKAIDILEGLSKRYSFEYTRIWRELALAYLRLGERSNCISNHAAESCIMPIRGVGVHRDTIGSRRAIAIYQQLMLVDGRDYESQWLLNLAYMTLGEYPDKVPKPFLIPNMNGDTTYKVNPFVDVAADLGLDVRNQAGGSITEDFDNDGYLDIVTSSWSVNEPMHYFHNDGNGKFSDRTKAAGIDEITGGLNIVQTDYNNDGFKDIFVLRGAWKGEFGCEPNSLLRNNGDGTFSDVTAESGLLSFHPTQTATWNDFNNDGWLDVFIGNESTPFQPVHSCEMYVNNHDGTFTEIAAREEWNVTAFVKGVTSGDYDHDGKKDIFLSTMNNKRILLKNISSDKGVNFKDVSQEAGINDAHGNSFPTWFWDYDNDGWLDIFVCDYSFKRTLSYYAAAEKLGISIDDSQDRMLLYHNNHDGTFTNVAKEVGLNTYVFAMGSNFGDIDNDGFLDMYLGTGNPHFQSLVPNKMFKNLGGRKFADVTASAHVGHLQKGHGVSFADMDNDGDQDIYIDMGGAYAGDSYQNSFFLNPGQGNNHWITISLEGTESNRLAIGSELKIVCTDNGVQRTIYREVNSGGSFGSSPLRREIGLGSATKIDRLEIHWHGSGKTQVFESIPADQFIKITEGRSEVETVPLKTIQWSLPNKLCDQLALR